MVTNLACVSFIKKNSSSNFSTFNIIKAFVSAICLSSFIYLSYFNITNQLLHATLAFIGFWLLFRLSKIGYFFTGFFIGVFWFYWMCLSFRFYEMSWAMPFVILMVSIVYGIMFWIPSLISTSPFIRALFLLLFLQIAPFGFNWFNFELIFYHTPFGLHILHVASFMLFVLLLQNLKGRKKFLCFIFLILSIDFSHVKAPNELPFEYTLVQTNISQSIKWDKEFTINSIDENFQKIEQAIHENKRLIIFPETAFPLYLNIENNILNRLLLYSQDIAIITGSLAYENDQFFNSAYFFDKGKMQRADKVVLVPFGETIPLPNFIAKKINKYVFGTENDFLGAATPTDFDIDNINIRSAICYEGSAKILHENSPHYMSVLTNNAWFLPSTEPTLQNLMLSLWATKSNTIILHAVNGQGGGVIKPRISPIKPLFDYFKSLF